MKIKKTSQEIEKEILLSLEEKPKTITELKQNIKSNWITVEKFLKKLSKEKKVKEMISTDKKKVYQLSYLDTYFEIPISKKEKEMFNSLYYLILEKYKLIEKSPTKTEFAKVAVEVIKNSEELKNLPTIWYLYGMIPLKAANPNEEYTKRYKFIDEKQIIKLIDKSVEDKRDKSSIQIQREQHEKEGELFYVFCEDFIKETKNNWDSEKILKSLNGAYINCPVEDEFTIFDFFDRFNSTIRKISLLNKNGLKEFKREIILTFDSFWKYYATYRAYKSLVGLKRFKDVSEIFNFYLGAFLESRRETFLESMSELYSIYLNKLGDTKLNSFEEIEEIRNILEDWTGE